MRASCLVLIGIAGCGAAARPRAPAVDCGPEIAELAPVLAAQRIVAIGELHGTREIPRVVGDAACRAAVAGREVIVAIEHDAREQPSIDHAVATGDPSRLLAEPLWTRELQDGRSSVAMRELVLRAHALRAAGLRVSVLAIDSRHDGNWLDRDPHMADSIARVATDHPQALVLVLAGLSHTWKVRVPMPTNPEHESAIWRVLQRGLAVYSIEVRQTDAESWGCFPRERPEPGKPYRGGLACEAHRTGDPSRKVAAPSLAPYPGRTPLPDEPFPLALPAAAYDAQLDLGGLSPSPPAAAR